MRCPLDDERRLIDIHLPDAPIYVSGDVIRLDQVISNVIGNAIKCGARAGKVEIVLGADEHSATLRIRDSGLGIPADELPRIFDVFMRGKVAQQAASEGLGVGLHVSRQLVRAHGGDIEGFSDGPGMGSEFVIRLPLSAERNATTEAPSDPLANSERRWRILVVDDNTDAANNMVELMESYGHDTRVAYDGRSALAAAAEMQPDVILLDIGLPDMTGYAVARDIRRSSLGKSVLLVAITGWGAPADRQRALDAGFDHHLTKPVDLVALGDILRGYGQGERAGHPG